MDLLVEKLDDPEFNKKPLSLTTDEEATERIVKGFMQKSTFVSTDRLSPVVERDPNWTPEMEELQRIKRIYISGGIAAILLFLNFMPNPFNKQ